MTINVKKFEWLILREVWPNETADFTPWLAENLDFLDEALSRDLSLVEREASVGSFLADLHAEDAYGSQVAIENQLGRTDHDHLGKMITYAVNLDDVETAVWICGESRPEHEAVIRWLNKFSPVDFYLLKLEAGRIVDSQIAARFTVIVGPNVRIGQTDDKKKDALKVLHLRFWGELLSKANQRTSLHASRPPSKGNNVTTEFRIRGLTITYVVRTNDSLVQLYIDGGDKEENKSRFDRLLANRERIEAAFGGPLGWGRLDGRRASRVYFVIPGGGLQDEERWPEIQDAMVDAMARLEKAFGPEVEQL